MKGYYMQIKEITHNKDYEKVNNVFHYTSPEGLYSILKNRTLRFTDCQFFNDKSEYIYIKQPLIRAIKSISPKLKNTNLIESIDNWFQEDYEVWMNNDNHCKQRYYAFCTSLDNDSLNMWNYYVKNGKYQGYNIGLSIASIIEYVKKIGSSDSEMWHGPVLYSSCEQEKVIFNLIQKTDNRLREIKNEVSYNDYWYGCLQEAQEEIIETIELYRLFFKDSAFKDEKEYRFVLKLPVNMKGTSTITSGYQVKGSILSPYFDLKFDDEILECITVSPMVESDLAKKGIELFLNRNNYKSIDFNWSNIPIRY